MGKPGMEKEKSSSGFQLNIEYYSMYYITIVQQQEEDKVFDVFWKFVMTSDN